MNPNLLYKTAIIPAMNMLGSLGIKNTFKAHQLILAIAIQESGVAYRRQVTKSGLEDGPAVSYWQFEHAGCEGLLSARSTSNYIRQICTLFDIKPTKEGLLDAIQYNDIVAACAARLLIYSLPTPLAETKEMGWEQYLSSWRPGKPHKKSWEYSWETAIDNMVKIKW
jgi:hypothetical protein